MLDLSMHGPKIDRPREEADLWFRPVIDNGRGAAFVDTSFLRAVIDHSDQYHAQAKSLFDASAVKYYTTAIVLAETVRQIVKSDARKREVLFGRCSEFVLDGLLVVCNPPREFVMKCYTQLIEARKVLDGALDLCDVISMEVLDYARHRRVFGFDVRHFSAVGALLEPGTR
jgi:predicted nucleic acid-binding protein